VKNRVDRVRFMTALGAAASLGLVVLCLFAPPVLASGERAGASAGAPTDSSLSNPVTPSSAAAQDSRAGLIAAEQQAKAGHLGREGPSALENWVERVENSPLVTGRSGGYPWLGSVYHGTSLGVGAGYLQLLPRGAHVSGVAAMSLQASTLIKAHAKAPDIGHGRATVELDGRQAVAKDLYFYGLGPNSPLGNRLKYDLRPTEGSATAAVNPVRWIVLSGGYRYLDLRTTEHVPGPRIEAPALGERLAYDIVQATIAIDWRSAPDYSTGGGFQRFTWTRYNEARDRPYSFEEFEYEIIQLLPILREQWVLAAHGLITHTKPIDEGGVPFVLMPILGNGETLRGFDTRRFADRNRLLLSGEYRWRPSRHIDMAVFVDAGKVEPRLEDLRLKKLESDVGIGIRFHSPTFVFLRAEAARSREGWQLILSSGKAF
jgi:hypothetical protein